MYGNALEVDNGAEGTATPAALGAYMGDESTGSVRTRFAAPCPELPGAASSSAALGKFDGGIEPTGAPTVL